MTAVPARPPAAEQVRAVRSLQPPSKRLVNGHSAHLVASAWWRAWAAHVGYGGSGEPSASASATAAGSRALAEAFPAAAAAQAVAMRDSARQEAYGPSPGPISQADILGTDGTLKAGLKEGDAYVVLTDECWAQLHAW